MKSSPNNSPNHTYHTYLLKFWVEPDHELSNNAWRFSLEDAHSGTRRGFTSLDSLLVYLQDLTGRQRGTAE